MCRGDSLIAPVLMEELAERKKNAGAAAFYKTIRIYP
jgi:hypothetical protein